MAKIFLILPVLNQLDKTRERTKARTKNLPWLQRQPQHVRDVPDEMDLQS